MKKMTLKFGETTIACETNAELSMTNAKELFKDSPEFDMPTMEIIGEVSNIYLYPDGNTSFEVDDHTIVIGSNAPEWLRPGVRVKVGLYDGTVLLLNDKDA